MNVIAWNCQGAASRKFYRTLKQFLSVYKPVILCLLEPKVSGVQADSICSRLGIEEWLRVEAFGFTGIWVLWRDTISVDILTTHPQFVNIRVGGNNTQLWTFSLVYGSPLASLRRELFSRCAGFVDWIHKEGLLDFGYSRSKYTWVRGQNHSTFKGARLDRALCNMDWRIQFPNADVVHLPRVTSDHNPLLVRMDPHKADVAERYFKYNAKKHVLARIEGVQRSLAIHTNQNLLRLDQKLRKELEDILYQEELLWFQRSREVWIASGDRNTRYYHTATAVKKGSSRISSLKDDEGNFPPLYQSTWMYINSPVSPEEIKEGCNNTILVLIPKASSPDSVKQLRPIGLCNIVYKILTIVMTKRLKPVVRSLIAVIK
ncbi:PREDICTED: uncharacterized protein LOC109154147 [Ipomoea nil]|uniref:uncharacterized protein LOC109154147 n=1 Tax=Ipomoea nil TaxID=35883 RepID=UPI000901C2E9|nr:PREDICTED: uncharacterized protein LOC109154147 [Ipomoea nil]